MNKVITIDDSELQAALVRLERAGGDLTPAMRKIAGTLAAETERNFAAEGRPKWQALAETTKHMRVGGRHAYNKNGQLKASARRQIDAGFRILQHSGSLASSVSTDSDSMSAIIGSNKVYAAIQHFGGEAGRGRKVTLPARPYLPLTVDGELQPEVVASVLDTVLDHLKQAAGI